MSERTVAATGARIHAFAAELFPICRSLTGPGVRETLRILQRELPALTLHEVPSGTRCFDWEVPLEWTPRGAWIEGPDGRRVVDFADSNLHLVGYSTPFRGSLSLDELQPHLHSLPDQPDAIPYVTSYYRPRWGFCLSQRQRDALAPGTYHVVVDTELAPGHLSYGELVLPGESDREVFLSTYICHPTLANNELSGPTVATFLGKWLASAPRRYTYRLIFIPETIGAVCYLSRHLEHLQRKVVAGYNLTCMGDERAWNYMPSRRGGTLADRAAQHALGHLAPDYRRCSFLERGSDERQYCSPGVDLPVASIMRSRYGTYPEYHTSLDDLSVITPRGLGEAWEAVRRAIECVETNETLRTTVLGEPQLGRRGLYPTVGTGNARALRVKRMMDVLAYCDGDSDLLAVADTIGAPLWELTDIVGRLKEEGLLVGAPGSEEETR